MDDQLKESVQLKDVIEATCKFILCVLYTQLGKTFTAISKITTEIEQDFEQGRSIHLIFSMNTLLNNQQFAKRLDVIEKSYGKGSVCIFSSKYSGPYMHVKDRLQLQGLCADIKTCPRVVVMCSNTHRYIDGLEFLSVIDKNKTNIFRAFAYYDELHEYICDSLRLQIEQMHDLEIVKSILALTATPYKIFEEKGFWSRIRLINLDNFSDVNYVGHKDMIYKCVDDFFEDPYIRPSRCDLEQLEENTIGFVKHVLQKHPEIISKNTRTFIPAHIRRKGHNKIRELIFELNPHAIVIVINGKEKTLEYKDEKGDKKTIPLDGNTSKSEEVCETISRLIIQHKLEGKALVITGLLCVGMGQTLTHKTLGPFTSAIFGHLDLTNDEMYQLFGRITGRMKDWDTYVQTQVYCPTIIMHRCNVMEQCARNMACEHNGECVTQTEYIDPMSNMGEAGQAAFDNLRKQKKKKGTISNTEDTGTMSNTQDTDKNYELFDFEEDAIRYAKNSLGVKFTKRPSENAPAVLQKDGQNPNVEYLLSRMWGIDKKNIARMVPTIDNKWCVYWRPSLIEITKTKQNKDGTHSPLGSSMDGVNVTLTN
jgi:hypothetical protein